MIDQLPIDQLELLIILPAVVAIAAVSALVGWGFLRLWNFLRPTYECDLCGRHVSIQSEAVHDADCALLHTQGTYSADDPQHQLNLAGAARRVSLDYLLAERISR